MHRNSRMHTMFGVHVCSNALNALEDPKCGRRRQLRVRAVQHPEQFAHALAIPPGAECSRWMAAAP